MNIISSSQDSQQAVNSGFRVDVSRGILTAVFRRNGSRAPMTSAI